MFWLIVDGFVDEALGDVGRKRKFSLSDASRGWRGGGGEGTSGEVRRQDPEKHEAHVLVNKILAVEMGSVKANGREPKSCLGRIFNFKLGHFVMYAIAWHIHKHALA